MFYIWRDLHDCLNLEDYEDTEGSQTVFFRIASESGLFTCVSELLIYETDASIKGGRFMFAAASSEGHKKIVQLLLEEDADMGAKDRGGRTSLQRAAERGHGLAMRVAA